MKPRLILAMVLLAVVFSPSWAAAQVTGSGGVAHNQAAAAAMVVSQAPVSFLVFQGRVDHAAAGTGLRNFDSGTIRLRGIPAGSTVSRAFLYWAMICGSGTTPGPCPQSVPIEFEGRTIDSTLFSTGSQPCWVPGATLGAYRVDVTGLMPGTTTAAVANKVINGDYQISRFPFNPLERDGRDPWPPTPNLPKVEGATLVVVYTNTTLPLTGRVYIHHGADLFSGQFTATNNLNPAAPTPLAFVKFTRFGADGQVGTTGTSPDTNTSEEATFFGGPSAACATAVLTQIAGNGVGPRFGDLDSDWNGHDGGPLNQLWDTRTTAVTGLLGAGATNYCVQYVSHGDCMNAIGYVLSVR